MKGMIMTMAAGGALRERRARRLTKDARSEAFALEGRVPSSSTSQELSSALSVGKVVRRSRNESKLSATLEYSDLE